MESQIITNSTNIGEIVDEDEEESARNSDKILPWDRFSNWIHCICIVTFDLELGQALEVSNINKLLIRNGH